VVTGATRPYRPLLYAHVVLLALAALAALAAGLRARPATSFGVTRVLAAAALLAAAAPVVRAAQRPLPPRQVILNPAWRR